MTSIEAYDRACAKWGDGVAWEVEGRFIVGRWISTLECADLPDAVVCGECGMDPTLHDADCSIGKMEDWEVTRARSRNFRPGHDFIEVRESHFAGYPLDRPKPSDMTRREAHARRMVNEANTLGEVRHYLAIWRSCYV